MPNFLQTITAHKQKEIAQRKLKRPINQLIKNVSKGTDSFKNALKNPKTQSPHLIAELKKASPTEGLIRPRLEEELEDIVKIYNQYASAISCVTDEKFFQGRLEWIEKAKKMTHLPVLCKDFIIDEYQIYEARNYGADAILLIVSALPVKKLKKFENIAHSLGMNALIEVHTYDEIKTALQACKAEIIGINNRDLTTFKINIETTLHLACLIPADKIIVSESGFSAKGDIQKINGVADAVLIGTALMKAPDISKKIASLGFTPTSLSKSPQAKAQPRL